MPTGHAAARVVSTVKIFNAASTTCGKCGLVHERESGVRLGQDLFNAQFVALEKANKRGEEVGKSKMPGAGERVEVLEGVVERYRKCPD